MFKIIATEDLFNKFQMQPEYDYIFQSILLGNTPSEIYVDDKIDPKIMILWDTKITFYFLKNNAMAKDIETGITFLKEGIFDEGIKNRFRFIKIYSPDPNLNKLLVTEFNECNPEIYSRTLYKKNGDEKNELEFDLKNKSVQIEEITSEILNDSNLDNQALLLDEIEGMWKTKEAFLKEGFGYCCLEQRKIIGWCTAEYMSRLSCGCGVETITDYQRKGYATLMAQETANHAKSLGLDLYWDSWNWNEGSIKTAEKVEFSRVKNYDVVFLKCNV